MYPEIAFNRQKSNRSHERNLSGLLAALVSLIFMSCEQQPNAQNIIDAAITAHGGQYYQNSTIEFDFRNKHFYIKQQNGLFTYKRSFRDSVGLIQDVLNNDGFYREVDGARVLLSEAEKRKFFESVNSVVYFALLPYGLNDPAVQKRYLGQATLQNNNYYKIEVTFQKEGGGPDYQDVFVYWIHEKRKTLDYLAYYYHRNESGSRFRQAFNQRRVNGILFADYHNFKGPTGVTAIENHDQLFESGQLTRVSEIVLENIQVERTPQ
ncbi:MAG: DUF6503 family protein [bacterium]